MYDSMNQQTEISKSRYESILQSKKAALGEKVRKETEERERREWEREREREREREEAVRQQLMKEQQQLLEQQQRLQQQQQLHQQQLQKQQQQADSITLMLVQLSSDLGVSLAPETCAHYLSCANGNPSIAASAFKSDIETMRLQLMTQAKQGQIDRDRGQVPPTEMLAFFLEINPGNVAAAIEQLKASQ